jgi:hypothetical protein
MNPEGVVPRFPGKASRLRVASVSLGLSLLALAACTNETSSEFSTRVLVPFQPLDQGQPLVPATNATTAVRHLQPALAVRGMACLACHAHIQANVITDFGYGNAWYLGQNVAGWGPGTAYAGNLSQQSHYDPFTWQSLDEVDGQITIPAGTMPGSAVTASVVGAPSPSPPMDLASFLMLTTTRNIDPYWTDTNAATLSFTGSVNPGTDGAGNPLPAVVERNTVYIGAPTASQILAVAGTSPPAAGTVQALGQSVPGLAGIQVVTGKNGTPYLTNAAGTAVECVNRDVVVNGTLFLNQLTVHATQGGCRLYVTGPVFIQGQITYATDAGDAADATSNLQITSASAILLGVGLTNPSQVSGSGPDPLYDRLIGDSRNPLFRGATSSSAYSQWSQAIYQEGTNIGSSLLLDAANVSAQPGYATASSENGEIRISVPYQHLLLNAPVIHDRYLGQTQGVFIAEIMVASLGEFQFQYDAVFTNAQVSILPALSGDILCVADAASGCNPVVP